MHNGFATAGGFNTQAMVHDFAFAVVGAGAVPNGAEQELDVAVGSYPLATNVSSGNKLYAFGYPAAGKYRGKDLVYCAGNIFADPYAGNQTWGMTCNMTGGSSGGPWLSGLRRLDPGAELAELVRPPGPSEHVRTEVQRRTPLSVFNAADERHDEQRHRPLAGRHLASARFGRAAQQERVAIRVGLGCSMTLLQP